MVHPRAGQPATPEDLIDVDQVIAAYYDLVPDPANPDQQVVFGTSGHRGSSLKTAFNEAHIAATTQAIIEYRASQGITGPLFIGKDTHGLSLPAWKTALEVLHAAGVDVRAEREDEYTPTPAVSRAIIVYNRDNSGPRADGIVVTPSHNPPRDGGFKYNPPTGGPADTDATSVIAARANELIAAGWKDIKRVPYEEAVKQVKGFDFRKLYVDSLEEMIDFDAIREAGVRIGADPMGGASVEYWGEIAKKYDINLTVVNPEADPRWPFMTLDWDGKIRMDCSSPYSMASLRERMTPDADGNVP